MQLVPRYLLNKRVSIVADLTGFAVEYSPMYHRTIQVYKGIDNDIQFRLFNADQKGIDLSGYTPRFMAWDENHNLVIEKDGVVQDDGSSIQSGKFTVTITKNETLDLQDQYLSYTIYLAQTGEPDVITYTDTHFGNQGVIKLSSGAFPGVKASKSVTQFTQADLNSQEYISETLDAEPGINGNNALHTAAIYSDSYAGTITVQATLENNVTESTDWADVASVTLDGTETEPVPINFFGVFSHVRIQTDANPANTITKVLIRD